MISKAINQKFKTLSTLTGLAGSANYFFAEQGVGEKTVITMVVTPNFIGPEFTDVMETSAQVLAQGYGIDAAELLGFAIITAIRALANTTLTVDKWTYKIMSVDVPSMPVLLPDASAVSINFTIIYSQSLAA